MAYRTDGTANFNFFINRQGPRGPQGIQGPEGFSPNVQVEEDHGNTFTLRVTNKDNFFITSNLREHKEDRGGDYIRYDRAGQLMYIGDPNFATTVKAGEVRLSTVDDLTAGSDTVALTPKVYKDDITSRVEEVNQKIDSLDANNVKVTGDQAIDGRKVFRDRIDSNYVFTDHVYGYSGGRIFTNEDNLAIGNTQKPTILYSKGAGITLNGNTDYVLTQSRVTAGDGVAIEKTTSGIKISSTAQGDVTLAGDNSFTGNNTFDGVSTFNGDTWVNSLKVGTSLKNQQDKLFLSQSSITAGDNVTIEETTDGVKISSTGGGSSEPPANMVTTDTEQTITGKKHFESVIILRDAKIGSNTPHLNMKVWKDLNTFTYADIIRSRTDIDSGLTTIMVGADGIPIEFPSSAKLSKGTHNLILDQNSVTAGDNISITKTDTGVQITCNAPTNAQIEALQRLINDLSTKIDNLTTRLNNLEEVIDGGVAGSIYTPEPQKLKEQVVEGLSINEKINNVSEDVQVNDNGGT